MSEEKTVNMGTEENPIMVPEKLLVHEPQLPVVREEQILVCEKCGKELGFCLFFKKQEEICPTCHNQSEPDTCWLLCKTCRGYSN